MFKFSAVSQIWKKYIQKLNDWDLPLKLSLYVITYYKVTSLYRRFFFLSSITWEKIWENRVLYDTNGQYNDLTCDTLDPPLIEVTWEITNNLTPWIRP